jgi:Ca2+-transporting ATPase
VDAVREGRQLFANLRTSFQYLLMVHTPFVVSALAVPLLGYPLLFLPVHIVWMEMVIHPSALLVFQDRPGQRLELGSGARRLTLFSRRDWLVIALSGTITTTAVLLAYVRSAGEPGGVAHGRAAALATLVLASGMLAAVLSRLRTRVAWLVCLGTVASAVVLVQVPSLARLLHLGPLHAVDWLVAAGGALLAALPLGLGRGRSAPGRRLRTGQVWGADAPSG